MFTFFDKKKPEKWKSRVITIANNHTNVNGALAGLSAVILTLFDSSELKGLIGDSGLGSVINLVFIVASYCFICAGILYSAVGMQENKSQYAVFTIASSIYYLAVLLLFSAIALIWKFEDFDKITFWIVGAAGLGGYIAISTPIEQLLRLRSRYSILCLFCVFAVGWMSRSLWLRMGLSKDFILERILFFTVLAVGVFFIAGFLNWFSFIRKWPRAWALASVFVSSLIVSILIFTLSL